MTKKHFPHYWHFVGVGVEWNVLATSGFPSQRATNAIILRTICLANKRLCPWMLKKSGPISVSRLSFQVYEFPLQMSHDNFYNRNNYAAKKESFLSQGSSMSLTPPLSINWMIDCMAQTVYSMCCSLTKYQYFYGNQNTDLWQNWGIGKCSM